MISALVTGFGPYQGEPDNPSGRVAARLDGREHDGVRIAGRVLRVSTDRIGTALADAIQETRPDVVVVTGVAPGRPGVAVERIAVNVRDFPVEDVDGRQPVDSPIADDGPAAYFSTLPVKAILARWRAAGVRGYVSNTAGTFLCNQVFYLARHLTDARGVRAGLVHVPAASDQAATASPPVPSLPLDVIEEAVRLSVLVAAGHRGPDVLLGAGATH